MFTKTIKLGLSAVFAAALLAGCASTSDVDDTAQSDAGSAATSSSATSSSATSSSATTSQSTDSAALETVFYFAFDSAELTAESRAALTAQAAVLKASPRGIRLEGHADERGTREYNMALGERRALAVRDFLIAEGVNVAIESVSYGEERPFSPIQNEAAWALNRRVELK